MNELFRASHHWDETFSVSQLSLFLSAQLLPFLYFNHWFITEWQSCWLPSIVPSKLRPNLLLCCQFMFSSHIVAAQVSCWLWSCQFNSSTRQEAAKSDMTNPVEINRTGRTLSSKSWVFKIRFLRFVLIQILF